MIYIIFDLEATCDERGKQNFKNETIEIGAIKFNNDFKEDFFQSFVRPIFTPMTEFCMNLTGITEEDVKHAPQFPTVLRNFREWAFNNNEKDVVFCSWGFYDRNQIVLDAERHKVPVEEYIFIVDNHVSLKHEYPNIFKKEKIRKKGIGLGKALKKSGMEFRGNQHRALDDAYNIGRIFIKHYQDWGCFMKR